MFTEILQIMGLSSVDENLAFAMLSFLLVWMFDALWSIVYCLIFGKRR